MKGNNNQEDVDRLNKKLSGLQTARQYELNKSKKYKKALDKIVEYVRDYYMHPYSQEVIDIKNKVMKIYENECNQGKRR